MRVVNLEKFRELPSGTIYARGEQWYFDSLHVKGETFAHDFACLDPCWVAALNSYEVFEIFEEMLQTGASYPMDEDFGRDGLFEPDNLFLVFERADLRKLRAMIDFAIQVSPT